jgi:hypothetical protein
VPHVQTAGGHRPPSNFFLGALLQVEYHRRYRIAILRLAELIMGVFLNLSSIALREVVGGALQQVGGEKVGTAVIDFLSKHCTDHSQTLPKALQNANERAWRTLEIALGGESFWEKCKRLSGYVAAEGCQCPTCGNHSSRP